MTKQDLLIVKQAIKKANKGGYPYVFINFIKTEYGEFFALVPDKENTDFIYLTLNDLIFSKEFAKGLWGEEQQMFQYQSQQLVLEDNRIQYLKKFL